jgi:hypothetical protein
VLRDLLLGIHEWLRPKFPLDAVMGLHHLDRQKGGCPSE